MQMSQRTYQQASKLQIRKL